jgi:hypothetical protein
VWCLVESARRSRTKRAQVGRGRDHDLCARNVRFWIFQRRSRAAASWMTAHRCVVRYRTPGRLRPPDGPGR